MRVLLVEDDTVLGDGLSQSLADWGFTVTLATTGAFACTALASQPYDLLILDLGLPDMDGRDILQRLRERYRSTMPVLILTARDGLNDRVAGLELGADDYMTKPFELRELQARVYALMRRSHGLINRELRFGSLVLDARQQLVTHDGKIMELPPREYGVLEVLMLQAGRVVSKDHIAQRLAVHSDDLADNAIEVYIHRLRKRLEPFGVGIRTLRGLGYLLEQRGDA